MKNLILLLSIILAFLYLPSFSYAGLEQAFNLSKSSEEGYWENVEFGDLKWGLNINYIMISLDRTNNTTGKKFNMKTETFKAGLQPSVTFYTKGGWIGLGFFTMFTSGEKDNLSDTRINIGSQISFIRDWLVIGVGADAYRKTGDKTTGVIPLIMVGKEDFVKTRNKVDFRENVIVFIGTRFAF